MADFADTCSCCFDRFDKDGSGNLDVHELAALLVSIGYKTDETECMCQTFKDLDRDDNDKVSKAEFLREMGAQPHQKMDECTLRRMFKDLDVNGNGSVTADEAKVALSKINKQICEEDVMKAIADADVNGDGSVGAEEFIAFIQNC